MNIPVEFINPNSSVSVTKIIEDTVNAMNLLEPSFTYFTTMHQAPAGIITQTQYNQAADLVFDYITGQRDRRVFVVACFSDPGVSRLCNEKSRIVIGIGEAGLRSAITKGDRIGVLAISSQSIPRHLDYWKRLGLSKYIVAEEAAELSMAAFSDKNASFDRCLTVARSLKEKHAANVILLGCAGMSDIRERLEAALGIAVVDPVQAAVMALKTHR
ncbi:aspartate/glutamate racemase family protein [Brenneria rubrifaciens]|uniref:Asp/Glu racemase n=1 Tax=Brenneria rubrifaciens TaxID=55213 RepID=A0A4P8QT76_9GAMM|nr:aspartate/glutamate racemase family protein [Brenneria rubrifaciens]QCR09806.1 Asp/Glu racemase [Brenneria rubrifaciens]